MLLFVRMRNCLIFNEEVEFSMYANMHYRRFAGNVIEIGKTNVLKTAILIGPNNAGKTNFVKVMRIIKRVIEGQTDLIADSGNLFSDDPITEISFGFSEAECEYIFEIKYDTYKKEFIYERFARVTRDSSRNIKEKTLLLRDSEKKKYVGDNDQMQAAMSIASRSNILIHLLDTESFPLLDEIKAKLESFSDKLVVIDMNNIPIQKTIDMLKKSEEAHRKIAGFIRNADLYLDDFRYLTDDEVRIELKPVEGKEPAPQEEALRAVAQNIDMFHLASVYKGKTVPSIQYDSTGTKKMAALASYILDALEKGHTLIIDELDNSLHFRLTRAIIAMFNNELNKSAQLIATVHDVSLLDCKKMFRKEQIHFCHKDRERVYLYSLADFTAEQDGIRDTTDLIERYKRGTLGAIPEPDLFQSLLEVTENE